MGIVFFESAGGRTIYRCLQWRACHLCFRLSTAYHPDITRLVCNDHDVTIIVASLLLQAYSHMYGFITVIVYRLYGGSSGMLHYSSMRKTMFDCFDLVPSLALVSHSLALVSQKRDYFIAVSF